MCVERPAKLLIACTTPDATSLVISNEEGIFAYTPSSNSYVALDPVGTREELYRVYDESQLVMALENDPACLPWLLLSPRLNDLFAGEKDGWKYVGRKSAAVRPATTSPGPREAPTSTYGSARMGTGSRWRSRCGPAGQAPRAPLRSASRSSPQRSASGTRPRPSRPTRSPSSRRRRRAGGLLSDGTLPEEARRGGACLARGHTHGPTAGPYAPPAPAPGRPSVPVSPARSANASGRTRGSPIRRSRACTWASRRPRPTPR